MSPLNMKKAFSMSRLLPTVMAAVTMSLTATAHAAAPGITGPTFNLTAQPAYITQPDGQMVYSWGYGCDPNHGPSGYAPGAITNTFCNPMQVPGPTLIVTEGQTVSVTLTNNLPPAAGNTSILFPGFNVATGSVCEGGTNNLQACTTLADCPDTSVVSCTSNLCAGGTNSGQACTTLADCPDNSVRSCAAQPGAAGLLTQEAAPGGMVTYTFTASSPGTRAYYSGTQGDLQVEMGLYGAIIVLPNSAPTGGCPFHNTAAGLNGTVLATGGESDYRLSPTGAAYHIAQSCYDREYLFQFSEMDPNIHTQALAQVTAAGSCTAGAPGCSLEVPTEPYHPAYFLINGRSMPDDMDPNYMPAYPHQPYNGNPHMHPGDLTLLRIIGQGRWQHPFHEHANHVRVLARDGNLILSQSDPNSLAGPLLFTTTTTPGLAMDGIFTWTAKGLNWDAYGHNPGSSDLLATLPCTPDANGYNTGNPTAVNYYEWCQDHNKPLEVAPFGDVAGGGPATLPDANLFTNGAWYGGSPYLGPDATTRAVGPTGTTPPSGTIANPPTTEAGFAYMWHSHNEREITTNNAFPGGMLMMLLIDSREFPINESN